MAALPPGARKLLAAPDGVHNPRLVAAVSKLPAPIQKEMRAAFASMGHKRRAALRVLAGHSGATLGEISLKHPQALASLAGRPIVEQGLNLANRGECGVRELFNALLQGKAVHSLLYALVGSGDLDRLARCENPNCDNFFLRRRKDAKCCCRACANALDQRRWRERYAGQYKVNRYIKAESRRVNAVKTR